MESVNRHIYVFECDYLEMTIGQRATRARKAAGLSQEEVCKRVGIKQPTLSALETGSSAGTMHVASLAAIYGVNALWLEKGEGPERPTLPDDAPLIDGIIELLDNYKKASSVGRALILDAARYADRGKN